MPMAEEKMNVEVFRYDPAAGGETRFDTYDVPYRSEWVVLEELTGVRTSFMFESVPHV